MAVVETVRGPVDLDSLGQTLMHEHVFVLSTEHVQNYGSSYLGERIADFKIPQYVAVSATPLPRNPGGKLLKRRLREDVDWASAVRP